MSGNVMDFQEPVSALAPDSTEAATKHPPMCFVCGRCKYPICTSDSILFNPVDGGTTEHAFRYDLDCLLDVDDGESEDRNVKEEGNEPQRGGGVPCYSANDTILTSLCVSNRILDIPLAPAARLLAIESVVDSHANVQEQEKLVLSRFRPPPAQDSPQGGNDSDSPCDGAETHHNEPHTTAQEQQQQQQGQGNGAEHTPTPVVSENYDETTTRLSALINSPIRPLQSYGTTSEVRIDLVCLDEGVLGLGLKLSTKDRSAWVNPKGGSNPRNQRASNAGSDAGSEGSLASTEEQRRSPQPDAEPVRSPPQLPQAILDAIAVPPPPTHREGPGNFSVNEAFVTVKRRTTSASLATWFKHFHYIHRVECPDCHMSLGFLFQHQESPEAPTTRGKEAEKEEGEEERVVGSPASPEPSSKKEKKEPKSTHTPRSSRQEPRCDVEDKEKDSGCKKSGFPNRFIGLELKRISQQSWGLRDFQERYAKSGTLETFRSLFPEAEELQSIYGRLTALRTQSELYNNLLRKHKEQNDVQSALLQSQKSRMLTYEDKLLTMQQIISAQRKQLDMQTKQVKQQDDLLSSHRNQLNTMRQQMLVENMLLSEQSKTIESQREQIRVMKTHLGIQMIQERLNARRSQLEKQLRSRDNGDKMSPRNEGTPLSPRTQDLEADNKESNIITLSNNVETHESSAGNDHAGTGTEGSHLIDESQQHQSTKSNFDSQSAQSVSSPRPNSSHKKNVLGSQRNSHVSTTPCVSLVNSSTTDLVDSTPVSTQNQALPSSLSTKGLCGIQCAPRLPSTLGQKGNLDTYRGLVSVSASRSSNSQRNSGVSSTENSFISERQDVYSNVDSGFRAISVAHRRNSRLPPVHLRGVVSTNGSVASTRAARGSGSQEKQTVPEDHCAGKSTRN